MSKLSHPNLAKLYEVIDDATDKFLYLVLEYVPVFEQSIFLGGLNIVFFLKHCRRLYKLIILFCRQLIDVTGYIHSQHIAHRYM